MLPGQDAWRVGEPAAAGDEGHNNLRENGKLKMT